MSFFTTTLETFKAWTPFATPPQHESDVSVASAGSSLHYIIHYTTELGPQCCKGSIQRTLNARVWFIALGTGVEHEITIPGPTLCTSIYTRDKPFTIHITEPLTVDTPAVINAVPARDCLADRDEEQDTAAPLEIQQRGPCSCHESATGSSSGSSTDNGSVRSTSSATATMHYCKTHQWLHLPPLPVKHDKRQVIKPEWDTRKHDWSILPSSLSHRDVALSAAIDNKKGKDMEDARLQRMLRRQLARREAKQPSFVERYGLAYPEARQEQAAGVQRDQQPQQQVNKGARVAPAPARLDDDLGLGSTLVAADFQRRPVPFSLPGVECQAQGAAEAMRYEHTVVAGRSAISLQAADLSLPPSLPSSPPASISIENVDEDDDDDEQD